jgi:hypothetical protein
MIAGGSIHTDTSLVDLASLRAQSSHPSRQPSSSSPTPAHLATSFGSIVFSIHVAHLSVVPFLPACHGFVVSVQAIRHVISQNDVWRRAYVFFAVPVN